jgi:hypothetical protein
MHVAFSVKVCDLTVAQHFTLSRMEPLPMEKQPDKSMVGAAERAEIFHEQYGNDFDAANALPDFIIAAGDYISRIVGESETDAGSGAPF